MSVLSGTRRQVVLPGGDRVASEERQPHARTVVLFDDVSGSGWLSSSPVDTRGASEVIIHISASSIQGGFWIEGSVAGGGFQSVLGQMVRPIVGSVDSYGSIEGPGVYAVWCGHLDRIRGRWRQQSSYDSATVVARFALSSLPPDPVPPDPVPRPRIEQIMQRTLTTSGSAIIGTSIDVSDYVYIVVSVRSGGSSDWRVVMRHRTASPIPGGLGTTLSDYTDLILESDGRTVATSEYTEARTPLIDLQLLTGASEDTFDAYVFGVR